MQRTFNKACSSPSFFVHTETGKIAKIPCNRWQCDHCSYVKARRLEKVLNTALVQQVREHKGLIRVMTLTLKEDLGGKYITQEFNRFMSGLKKHGYKLTYFWAKEFQERGARHLHVIVFKFIPQHLIQSLWKVGWASIKRGSRGAAKYLTKYLSKGAGDERYLKNERRYCCSRGFLAPQKKRSVSDEPSVWTFYTHEQFEETFGSRVEGVLRKGRVDQYNDLYNDIVAYEPNDQRRLYQ